jgi:hypothetical protein
MPQQGEKIMFAPSIQVEYVSFYEPAKGVWRKEPVNVPSGQDKARRQDCSDEDFEAFCRRSLF